MSSEFNKAGDAAATALNGLVGSVNTLIDVLQARIEKQAGKMRAYKQQQKGLILNQRILKLEAKELKNKYDEALRAYKQQQKGLILNQRILKLEAKELKNKYDEALRALHVAQTRIAVFESIHSYVDRIGQRLVGDLDQSIIADMQRSGVAFQRVEYHAGEPSITVSHLPVEQVYGNVAGEGSEGF